MPKIYIGKTIFEMNRSSKNLLEVYLKDLKHFVLENDVDIEVYEDIKYRLEEKLKEMMALDGEIKKDSIEKLIQELWKPKEIFDDEKRKTNELPKLKKLYKNSKKWKILWVCYGIWQSLGIQALRIRITFIFLFLIFHFIALLLYIVLAVVMPDEANISDEEKLVFDTSSIEWIIKTFFHILYNLWKKIINALK